jgi:ferritin
MLSQKVEDALNQQIAMEGNASQKYLAMANWCDTKALSGCAQFFYKHAEEERMHMLKLLHYVNDAGGNAIIPAVDQPSANFDDVQVVFETAYSHEQKVSQSIDDLVELSETEKDKQTANFLQWYVDEQHEEEALYRTLIDRIKLIGLQGRGLYFIDNEVATISAANAAAEAVK